MSDKGSTRNTGRSAPSTALDRACLTFNRGAHQQLVATEPQAHRRRTSVHGGKHKALAGIRPTKVSARLARQQLRPTMGTLRPACGTWIGKAQTALAAEGVRMGSAGDSNQHADVKF